MNDLIVEGTKIISFGNTTGIPLTGGMQKIENYVELWPVNENQKKLPKKLCYWDETLQKVLAKTQGMLDIETAEEIKILAESKVLNKIPEFLIDCVKSTLTFDEFKNKINNILT